MQGPSSQPAVRTLLSAWRWRYHVGALFPDQPFPFGPTGPSGCHGQTRKKPSPIRSHPAPFLPASSWCCWRKERRISRRNGVGRRRDDVAGKLIMHAAHLCAAGRK